jgi:hypothetical protein
LPSRITEATPADKSGKDPAQEKSSPTPSPAQPKDGQRDGEKPAERNPPTSKPPVSDKPPIISPAEASEWEGKVVTVRLAVKSTYDGFDWAFLVNTESDFRAPGNFSVVVDKKTAVAEYRAKGVSLEEYFQRDATLLVTGKVQKYTDKRSGKVRYEIQVKRAEQIKAP